MFHVDKVTTHKDAKGLYSTLYSERSPVARHIRRQAVNVVLVAKLLVGKRTGRLSRSIRIKRDRTHVGGYSLLVGSPLSYAMVHHQGARPHVIRARKPGGMLSFRSRGNRVVTRMVHHPGHAANPYLVEALRAVVGR